MGGGGEGGGKGKRVREEGLSAATSTRARALFEFVVHTMHAVSAAMQFSRGWASVVVRVAMLTEPVCTLVYRTGREWQRA